MAAAALIAIASDVQTVGDQKRYTIDTIPVDHMARTVSAVPLIFAKWLQTSTEKGLRFL